MNSHTVGLVTLAVTRSVLDILLTNTNKYYSFAHHLLKTRGDQRY